MKEDKGKIWTLYVIIAFLVVLIGCLIVITFLNIRYEAGEKNTPISTTTRRTVITTTSRTTKESTSSTTSKTTKKNTTTKEILATTKKSNKTTTTTKNKTIPQNTNKTSSVIPEVPNYEVTNSPTNYPNAIDDWEWNIVNAINRERKQKGLPELKVAKRLRTLAEEAADYWYEYSDTEIEEYLEGYSHYGMKSNNLDNTSGYEKLIERTKAKTNITSNKSLQYIGVGVIYLDRGINGIKTHYYVIIYE